MNNPPKTMRAVALDGFGGVDLHAYDGQGLDDGRLNDLVAADNRPFHVEVARTFDLDDVADAHRLLASHHLGKLALRLPAGGQ